jgi:hypothetical protein
MTTVEEILEKRDKLLKEKEILLEVQAVLNMRKESAWGESRLQHFSGSATILDAYIEVMCRVDRVIADVADEIEKINRVKVKVEINETE